MAGTHSTDALLQAILTELRVLVILYTEATGMGDDEVEAIRIDEGAALGHAIPTDISAPPVGSTLAES